MSHPDAGGWYPDWRDSKAAGANRQAADPPTESAGCAHCRDRPSDVDAHDEHLLIEDARQAVKELDRDRIFTYCISLDPKADEYVGDIFGRQYTVVDNIQRLPEKLPELFMALTK